MQLQLENFFFFTCPSAVADLRNSALEEEEEILTILTSIWPLDSVRGLNFVRALQDV